MLNTFINNIHLNQAPGGGATHRKMQNSWDGSQFSPRALGPLNSMWYLWDTHWTSKNARTSSVRSILHFLEFFKNQVPYSLDFEQWNSLPQPPDLQIQCDFFGTLIGPPKMQKQALCDQSSIFWEFSKVRYPTPQTSKNEILSHSPRTFKFNVILLGHSSDHQKCKNQLCVIIPLFFWNFSNIKQVSPKASKNGNHTWGFGTCEFNVILLRHASDLQKT